MDTRDEMAERGLAWFFMALTEGLVVAAPEKMLPSLLATLHDEAFLAWAREHMRPVFHQVAGILTDGPTGPGGLEALDALRVALQSQTTRESFMQSFFAGVSYGTKAQREREGLADDVPLPTDVEA